MANSPPRSGPDARLRPTERIRRPSEFQAVLRGGRCVRHPLLRIHYRENGRELSRIGLVVSRKVGNAVVRNRLKRILREVFRASKGRFPAPLDVVLIPEPRAGPGERGAYVEVFESFLADPSRGSTPRSAGPSRGSGPSRGAGPSRARGAR